MKFAPHEELTLEELRATPLGSTFTFDVECFKNYFLVGFRCRRTGKYLQIEGSPDVALNVELLWYMLISFRLVGFNSRAYDAPMIACALKGFSIEKLHAASQTIIRSDSSWWNVEKILQVTVPRDMRHVDLFEVVPLAKAYGASLKMRGAQMHTRHIQDLPLDPNFGLLQDEVPLIKGYNRIDLQVTDDLVTELSEELRLRDYMSEQYGVDLMSKSDAQIAEAVIGARIKKLTGERPKKPPSRVGSKFAYKVPDYIGFSTPQLEGVLKRIRAQQWEVGENGAVMSPDWLDATLIAIGKGRYQMGVGGLHSQESKIAYKSDDRFALIDRDVASYYPAVIINQGLYPAHIGPVFKPVYSGIVSERVAAKKAKDHAKAESLKVTVNGGFGKLQSIFSILYSPELFLQVTLTGQLSLLMLIERLESLGIPVVSANTDGIVIACPHEHADTFAQVIVDWERMTGFSTEETRYSAYYARDVNNFVAFKLDGKVKSKGAYGNPWAPDHDKRIERFKKNPTAIICVEALIAFLRDRTPIEATIRGCQDPRQFAIVRRAAGGGWKDGEALGKVARWYWSTSCPGPIKTKKGHAVADSDKGRPIQIMPDGVPPDLDYKRYIERATGMLSDVGFAYKRQMSFY